MRRGWYEQRVLDHRFYVTVDVEYAGPYKELEELEILSLANADSADASRWGGGEVEMDWWEVWEDLEPQLRESGIESAEAFHAWLKSAAESAFLRGNVDFGDGDDSMPDEDGYYSDSDNYGSYGFYEGLSKDDYGLLAEMAEPDFMFASLLLDYLKMDADMEFQIDVLSTDSGGMFAEEVWQLSGISDSVGLLLSGPPTRFRITVERLDPIDYPAVNAELERRLK